MDNGTNYEMMMEQLLAKVKACHKEMTTRLEAKIVAWLVEMKAWQKETMACQEVMETCLEKREATSEEMKFIAEHQKSLMKRPWWR
jgi:SAM-dependent MidA family methyltransferase